MSVNTSIRFFSLQKSTNVRYRSVQVTGSVRMVLLAIIVFVIRVILAKTVKTVRPPLIVYTIYRTPIILSSEIIKQVKIYV